MSRGASRGGSEGDTLGGIAAHPRFFVWGWFSGRCARSDWRTLNLPADSFPPPAGYPFVDVRIAVGLLKVLLCLYPWGYQPLAVVFSETQGARTVVRVSGGTYIAAAAGRGGAPGSESHGPRFLVDDGALVPRSLTSKKRGYRSNSRTVRPATTASRAKPGTSVTIPNRSSRRRRWRSLLGDRRSILCRSRRSNSSGSR